METLVAESPMLYQHIAVNIATTNTAASQLHLHDSMTSLCKSILPCDFKRRQLIEAEQKLSKLQSDSLMRQQNLFH
ncbi:hypothetical protein C1H46_026591 [Malus baccata]|uniref:Uncharacterized protein n=1 Tax=Malus baccata TaxID=106549 RepID=A0A540LN01_MALBA|nr:hypothetical protein C1H46_026591 [Malus baccata]